ncbi:MAG TPA: His/Gly/Thr/Pro-type tRNA ligase C-terminal domain-containing protein [Candidatus Paceibacterota bacterium]|nr:His/Gly/Thr/Pro-type tRNA ligase C-terminal domain-containing protein [Candidatus Paceibacterota bacterium]
MQSKSSVRGKNTRSSGKKTTKPQSKNPVARALEFFGFTELNFAGSKDIQQIAQRIIPIGTISKTEAQTRNLHRIAAIRHAETHGVQGAQPLLSYTVSENTVKKTTTFHIDIIGIQRGVAEALMIGAISSTLKRLNVETCTWKLNCTGEKDAYTKFVRDVGNYFKKNMSELTAPAREALKQSPLLLLANPPVSMEKLVAEAPQSINFLSESSREYFKEVLEFMESTDCMYEIDNSLLPAFEYENGLLAKLEAEDNKKNVITASLTRYSALGKLMQSKRDLPAVGASLTVPTKLLAKKPSTNRNHPPLYIIHVGPDARKRTLSLLMELEDAGIQALHGLLKDKLGSQMMNAEQLKVEYILLIGQKEFVEKNIIVRNTVNRSEKAIPQNDIVKYIKEL